MTAKSPARLPERVIRDGTSRLGPPVDVRFNPKATEALLCSEMTQWARTGHAGHLRQFVEQCLCGS
jgi:hypothetical protein